MDYFFTTGQLRNSYGAATKQSEIFAPADRLPPQGRRADTTAFTPAEVERLKALEALPAVPRATLAAASANGTRQPKNELLAPPSVDAIESAESAFRTERELATDTHQLARKKIHWEGLELDDRFEARDEARRNKEVERAQREQEAYDKQLRQWQAQAAADERRQFEKKWLSYALEHKPWDGPDDYAVLIRPEVMTTLDELQPDEHHYTVERLIKGTIARALKPWQSEQERAKATERAVDALPWPMRTDKNWMARARIAAAAAVGKARADASPAELKAVAEEAIRPLTQQCQQNERVQQAVMYLYLPFTTDEDQEAREAARMALSALPFGASPRQFEQAKQNAIEPIRARIEARIQRQRDEEERQALIARIASRLPPDLSDTEKTTTLTKAAKAVAALPARASREQREQTEQQAIERAERKAEQYRKKAALVEYGLRQIYAYAQRMLRQFDYDSGETAWSIESRVKSEVRKALEEELNGTESEQEVGRIVRELMREIQKAAIEQHSGNAIAVSDPVPVPRHSAPCEKVPPEVPPAGLVSRY